MLTLCYGDLREIAAVLADYAADRDDEWRWRQEYRKLYGTPVEDRVGVLTEAILGDTVANLDDPVAYDGYIATYQYLRWMYWAEDTAAAAFLGKVLAKFLR